MGEAAMKKLQEKKEREKKRRQPIKGNQVLLSDSC